MATTRTSAPHEQRRVLRRLATPSVAIECAIADLMAVIRGTAEAIGSAEYDVRVGINWTDEQPLAIPIAAL